MPIQYTTLESVKLRLTNKVQFQAGAQPVDGELPDDLLNQIIQDAETEVEQDLRGRYVIPFKSIKKNNFVGLPDHTKRSIRMVVDFKAVIIVLNTDFGRGSHINGDDYSAEMAKMYHANIAKLLGRDQEGAERNRFRFTPPLDDLQLAISNRMADDGFKGRIINTDGSEGDSASYAIEQINDPSKSYISRRIPNGTGGL